MREVRGRRSCDMDEKTRLRKMLGGGARPPADGRPAGRSHEGEGCVRHTDELDVGSVYGEVSIRGVTPLSTALLQAERIALRPSNGDPAILFLDLETTGLSGGSGTVAFLAGMGLWRGDSEVFRMERVFLASPSCEAEFLECVGARLAEADLVVCFNGKSFDLPLLETRRVMQGMPRPDMPPVLDLLHPARRLWKGFLGRCDLQSIERGVLGMRREGDVPGEAIPAIYFDYLRTGRMGEIERVFLHNRMDVLAMAALLAHVNGVLEAATSVDEPTLPGVLRTFLSKGCHAEFLGMWGSHEHAIRRCALGHAGAARSLAFLLKKAGRREEAYQLFLGLSAECPMDIPESMIEVLIHEEHRLRDLQSAMDHCLQFLQIASGSRSLDRLVQNLLQRKNRLERKLSSAPVASTPPQCTGEWGG